jgi:hydrogenase maturation protease
MGALAPRRVLVAGVGNIFLGDDGFGVETVRRLRDQPPGAATDVADFGIRGIHLAYEIAGGAYGAVLLVDAVCRGSAPGTIHVIDASLDRPSGAASDAAAADAHGLTPDAVIAWLDRLGAPPLRLYVVGCEPECIGEGIGLSPCVEASIAPAIETIRRLVTELTGSA